MAVITFIQDVTLEGEPEGSGPHYRKGYAPDVSDKEAQKWIAKGVAVWGARKISEPVAPVAVEKAPGVSRPRRRGRKWHPLDENAAE